MQYPGVSSFVFAGPNSPFRRVVWRALRRSLVFSSAYACRRQLSESLAIYTQTVLQGGFVLSKARGNRAPLLEALAHLRNHLTLLFNKETWQ